MPDAPGAHDPATAPRFEGDPGDSLLLTDLYQLNMLQAYRDAGMTGSAVRCAGGESTVEVADSGPGIPADKLAEIFGEFEQLSIGPGRTVGGVGLGLTIAKLIVEQHGGRIWAESEPGSGARFYFALKTCLPTAEKLS